MQRKFGYPANKVLGTVLTIWLLIMLLQASGLTYDSLTQFAVNILHGASPPWLRLGLGIAACCEVIGLFILFARRRWGFSIVILSELCSVICVYFSDSSINIVSTLFSLARLALIYGIWYGATTIDRRSLEMPHSESDASATGSIDRLKNYILRPPILILLITLVLICSVILTLIADFSIDMFILRFSFVKLAVLYYLLSKADTVMDNLSSTRVQELLNQVNSSWPKIERDSVSAYWEPSGRISLVILLIIASFVTYQTYQMIEHNIYLSTLSAGRQVAFSDPLHLPIESQWDTTIDAAGCQFSGGAYHVKEVVEDYQHSFPSEGYQESPTWNYRDCLTRGIFGNFAFEVGLTIIEGECGGMTFRENDNGNSYYFAICENGSYNIYKMLGDGTGQKMQYADSFAIHSGLGQQNKIAVVADGSTLSFYINEQQVYQRQDSSYTSGRIGLIASALLSTTDVAYNNARLWCHLSDLQVIYETGKLCTDVS